MLLRDGETCPRVARAGRAALLVDMACYFEARQGGDEPERAGRSTCSTGPSSRRRSSIPAPTARGTRATGSGTSSKNLAAAKPEVDVRILCWDSSMPVAATQHFFPLCRPQGLHRHEGSVRAGRQAAVRRLSPPEDDRHRRPDRLLRRRRHRPGPLGTPRPISTTIPGGKRRGATTRISTAAMR